MPRFSYDFNPANHFTTGAIGLPGDRTFFLQAGRGIEYVSMICEKEQMRALGEGLLSLLDQIGEAFPQVADQEDEEEEEERAEATDLIEPVIPVWRVAQLGVGYDEDNDLIVVLAQEMVEDEDETPEVGRLHHLPAPGAGFCPPGVRGRELRTTHLSLLRRAHRSRRTFLPPLQRTQQDIRAMIVQTGEPGVVHTVDKATALRLLQEGAIEPYGAIPWSSNYALLVSVQCDDLTGLAVYKPRRGERPLWDFPPGTLYRREYAAYLLSEALGWELVPPTTLRNDIYGPGTLQLFVDSDPEQHYFSIYPRHADDFRRIALFDIVINNTDRKAGHCLLDADDHMWSIDHGICFHVEPKLRTVIWEFAGEPAPPDLLADLRRLQRDLHPDQALHTELLRLLSAGEVKALGERLTALIAEERFPYPDPNRHNHPWPPI